MKKDKKSLNILKDSNSITNNITNDYIEKNIKEIWYSYYYSTAYHYKLITEKTLKQFWPFPIYDEGKIPLIFELLKKGIAEDNTFLEIANDLLRKPWLDIYLEAAKIHPIYFRNHFYNHKKEYNHLISNCMFQMMIDTKDTSEETYLNYTKYDLQPITDNLFMVSKFWATRNYYKVIQLIDPSWAFKIYNNTVNIYCLYIKDLELINSNNQNSLGKLFKKLKTLYGKVYLLEKIWEHVKINTNIHGQVIDYSPMIEYKDDILEILEESLASGDEIIIENISAIIIALHSVYTLDKDYNMFKEQSLKIYEKYKKNSVVAQNFKFLTQKI